MKTTDKILINVNLNKLNYKELILELKESKNDNLSNIILDLFKYNKSINHIECHKFSKNSLIVKLKIIFDKSINLSDSILLGFNKNIVCKVL